MVGEDIVQHGEGEPASARSLPLQLIAYGPDDFIELSPPDVERIIAEKGRWPVVWVNVEAVADAALIHSIGAALDLHPLALEDVLHLNQRAKVEEYGHMQFIVARMVCLKDRLETEQLSLFLGEGFVATFQEGRPGDPFDDVRERIRLSRGRIRSEGPDYLAYALLDAVVDGYFPIIERYGELLEDLEEEILTAPSRESVGKIHRIKREFVLLRRAIWPLRDALASLARDPVELIKSETRIYLRDCYDHSMRIIDLLEVDRELCSDLMDVYLSSVSNRMNEVIKVLTIVTTILMPPSFIAAIYGMNFNTAVSPFNMPELNWYFGYALALAVMAASIVGGCLVWYLWEKGRISRLTFFTGKSESAGGSP